MVDPRDRYKTSFYHIMGSICGNYDDGSNQDHSKKPVLTLTIIDCDPFRTLMSEKALLKDLSYNQTLAFSVAIDRT